MGVVLGLLPTKGIGLAVHQLRRLLDHGVPGIGGLLLSLSRELRER